MPIIKLQPLSVVELKKPHPCGEKRWLVLRTGIELRLKCTGCTHTVLVPRAKLEKNIRSVTRPDASDA